MIIELDNATNRDKYNSDDKKDVFQFLNHTSS